MKTSPWGPPLTGRVRQPIAHAMVTQAFELPGHRTVRSLGVSRGIVVRSRSIVGSVLGGLQTILGGNISIYRTLCEDARDEAFRQMLQDAGTRGANAVIGMRYESNEVMAGVTEVLAYGTAVLVEPSTASQSPGGRRRAVRHQAAASAATTSGSSLTQPTAP